MSKKLTSNVIVDGKEYAAGDTVPAAVAEKITNPKAWAVKKDADTSGSGAPDTAGGGDQGGAPAPVEPPRAGKGSGKEAWQEYATALGVEVPEGAERDAIVELVDQHNSSK